MTGEKKKTIKTRKEGKKSLSLLTVWFVFVELKEEVGGVGFFLSNSESSFSFVYHFSAAVRYARAL